MVYAGKRPEAADLNATHLRASGRVQNGRDQTELTRGASRETSCISQVECDPSAYVWSRSKWFRGSQEARNAKMRSPPDSVLCPGNIWWTNLRRRCMLRVHPAPQDFKPQPNQQSYFNLLLHLRP